MTAHVHAALMAEYAKDAAETDKPWKRWEGRLAGLEEEWHPLSTNPEWKITREYRRKRIALCQVEGRDVFPGDKLWHKIEKRWVIVGGKYSSSDSHLRIDSHGSAWVDDLAWVEQSKTKTVYQWAYLVHDTNNWVLSQTMSSDESNWRDRTGIMNKVMRLDWTALEVPV